MNCDKALNDIFKIWGKRREEEAATMGAYRKPTEEEIERAMTIGKWFLAWNESTGPCPIEVTRGYWGKMLCALFEWIAVLETSAKANVDKFQTLLEQYLDAISIVAHLSKDMRKGEALAGWVKRVIRERETARAALERVVSLGQCTTEQTDRRLTDCQNVALEWLQVNNKEGG